MAELRVGIIGCGGIGTEHADRITNKLSGAKVTGCTDLFPASAERVAQLTGCKIYDSGATLIQSDEVDAVIVATIGSTHKEYVMEAIKAGKPVFCEKPLTETAADSREVVNAEIAGGKKLVQVGFMRRYDESYIKLKEMVDSGMLGAPLLIRCAHRNPEVGTDYITPMAITDTAIHEIDCLHWLIDDDYESVQTFFGRKSKYAHENLMDPQLVLMRTKKGVLIELEIHVNCQYGYDIRCEVVGEEGTAALPNPMDLDMRLGAKQYNNILTDWKDRFRRAYDTEIQDWINDTLKGEVNGPTAWDGYVASVTADACVKSQTSGKEEPIETGDRPLFYDA